MKFHPVHSVHAEDHPATDERGATANLRTVFFLNFSFTLAEFIGGAWTNSMAIQSDALHDLGDTLAIGLAWWLQRMSSRGPSAEFTFGYRRFSLLGALLNSVILLIGGAIILYAATQRFLNPEPVHTTGMIGFAVAGILINGLAAWRASRGASMNEQVLKWHLLEDVMGWVAVGIASVVLLYQPDWVWLDPLLSVAITLWVLYHVVQRLGQTLRVFLQALPPDLDPAAVEAAILQVPGVESLHACRIWSLDGERHVFSAHLTLASADSLDTVQTVKDRVYESLAPFAFYDITIEVEFPK